jgi:hypothetical protein
MAIGRDIIGNLAEQFGYSKELVREALSSNQIDPLTASLIGSRIDKLQQSKQEAASRTTVMEDVLAPKPEEVMGQGIAGVPQEAPSALAALPSNLPAQEMASGGIVAFADGGELDLDDDEDEVREKSTLSQLMSGLSSGLASLRRAVPESRGISIPKSYEGALAEKGQTPATVRKMMIEGPKKGDYVMPPIETSGTPKRGGHKYEADVVREAERIGLDPNLAVHVLYKETGNLKNPETARSRAGALGVMQLMPKTAKGLGVDPMNPEENIRGGVTYLKQMMDQFNDPTLALAAYNAGPGRVNQILRSGRGIEALPRETQNYVRMADGGIVAFQAGGLGGEFGGSGEEEERVLIDPYSVRDPMTGEVVPSGYRKTVRKSEAPAEAIIKKEPPKPESSPAAAPDLAPAPEISKEQIEKLIGGTQGGEKEDGMMKRYMALLEGREKSSADQRKQDAYQSLLSAGLGMMGGTSPFAAVNIGQGAQAGIAAQAAARKTQAAEEAATLKGFGTAAAAEEYAKQRQLVAAQNRDTKLGNLIANREKQLESLALGTVTKIGLNIDSAEGQARLAKEIQRLKSTDTLLPRLYQEYGLPPVQAAAPAKPLTADELIAQKKAERKRLGLE